MLPTTERMTPTSQALRPNRLQLALHTYQDLLHRLLDSPAVWVLSGLWLLSVLTLVLTGYLEYVLGAFGWLGIALVIGLVSVALTVRDPIHASPIEQAAVPAASRKWIWAQIGVLLIFILFTAYRGMVLHHAAQGWFAQIPILSPLASYTLKLPWLVGNPTLNALLHPFTSSPPLVATTMLMNPFLYIVLPLILLLLLRARFNELGFGRGSRAWIVLVAVCFLPIVAILVMLASGQTLRTLAFSLAYNALVAGVPEEVLFRGALLTRLSRLWGGEWAVVLSTLVFGLWHMGLAMSNTNGNLLAAIASSIALQGIIGLWFAILFVRTRNLLAPMGLHSLWNVLWI